MAPTAKRAKVAKGRPAAAKPVNARLKSPEVSESGSSESELDIEDNPSDASDASEVDASEGSEVDVSDSESDGEPEKDHFDSAMSAILGSRVKAHDADNPILIRNKRTAKEIDEAREDRKVRRALHADRQQFKDKARVKQVVPKDPELAGEVISRERTLRKTAQRGVVKLLNAITSAQTAAAPDAPTDRRRAEASTEMSKEKFLDMIRMG